MTAEIETATVDGLIFGLLTGSTCGDGCWHAVEEACRCSCAGRNHGILNRGGARPNRTCKIDGEFYELVGVIPGPTEGEAWIEAYRRTDVERKRVSDERFPGLDSFGYGEWRLGKTMPVVDRKVSEAQAKWPEVIAVPKAYHLIWARPAGSKYIVRGKDGKSTWSNEGAASTLTEASK